MATNDQRRLERAQEKLDAIEANGQGGLPIAQPIAVGAPSMRRSKSGKPERTHENVLIVLRHSPDWKGLIGHDTFAEQIVLQAAPPWLSEVGEDWQVVEWGDADSVHLVEWLSREHNLQVPPKTVHECVMLIASEESFSPPARWLATLNWDRIPRVNKWLHIYLGCEDCTYTSQLSVYLLVALVRRALDPGHKIDQMIVLEGDQGVGKSTALRTLIGAKWFNDSPLDIASKDGAIQLQGTWLYEISELESFSKRELTTIKAYLSRQHDRFRPPYGKFVATFRRQTVFVGTTNQSHYLIDETGNRRFLPITVGAIDLEALKRDRDQLFAEAMALAADERNGWLSYVKQTREVVEAQERRVESDPWEDDALKQADELSGVVRRPFQAGEVLKAMDMPIAQITKAASDRIGRILRMNGFRYGTHRDPVTKKVIKGYRHMQQNEDSPSTESEREPGEDG